MSIYIYNEPLLKEFIKILRDFKKQIDCLSDNPIKEIIFLMPLTAVCMKVKRGFHSK